MECLGPMTQEAFGIRLEISMSQVQAIIILYVELFQKIAQLNMRQNYI
jgi:hypothetical protein